MQHEVEVPQRGIQELRHQAEANLQAPRPKMDQNGQNDHIHGLRYGRPARQG